MDEPTCLVCNIKTNETHFEKLICKKCSSFVFRCMKLNKMLRCKLNRNNCDLTSGKNLCRKCRYDRCVELNLLLPKKPKCLDGDVKNDSNLNVPSFINIPLSNSDVQVYKNNIKCDFEKILATIRNTFSQQTQIGNGNYDATLLQTIAIAVENFRKRLPINKREDIVVTQMFNYLNFIDYYHRFAIETAKMLMELQPFRETNTEEKFQIFRDFLDFFFQTIKLLNSFDAFGYDSLETTFLFDQRVGHKVGHLILENKEFTKEISDEMSKLFLPLLLFEEEFIFLKMKSLKMDKMEVAWLLSQVLFSRKHMEGIRLETTVHYERLLKITCNELNNYYFISKKINYLWKISEMVKLIEKIKQCEKRRMEVFIVAKICSIFDWTAVEEEFSPVYKL